MENIKKYEWPKTWARVSYSELVTNISTNGKKLNQKQYLKAGSFPVFDQGKDYIGGYTDDASILIHATFPVIVFGDHTRSVKLVKEPFAAGADGVKVVQPEKFINPKLLEYFTQYLALSIKDKGYARHYQWVAKEFVGLPPEREQERILCKIEELFSELDKGIESLKTAREQLKVYRQSLLKHAFEGKLTEQWRKDNADKLETADELLGRIQQEREDDFNHQLQLWKVAIEVWKASGEVGKKPAKPRNLPAVNVENEGIKIQGLPESWHCLKLVDFVLSLGQGWSPKCNNQPASDGEWGVIKTTAIQHLEYLEKENKQLPGSLHPRPWLELKKDDILITRAGPRNRVGVVCRVIDTREKLLLCDKAYRMRFPQFSVSPAFIESVLNASDFKRKIEELKTGISDSGLNITQPRLLGLYFPIPSLEEQLEIESILAEKLSVIEANISYIDINLKKSEALHQSILKKVFAGQLVSQDPNDEPASELLNRIAEEKAELEAAAKAAKSAAKKDTIKKSRAKNLITKKSIIGKKVTANTKSKEQA